MEEMTGEGQKGGDGTLHVWVRFAAKLTACHTDTYGDGQHTSGAMDGSSRTLRRAHIVSLIRVHVGVDKRCRAIDSEPPTLQAKNRTRDVPLGRWNVTYGFDSRENSQPARHRT